MSELSLHTSDLEFPPELFEPAFLARYFGNPSYFGNPDGARADLSDFVDLTEIKRAAVFNSNSASVRAVIGRKGSGKTLYLRKLAAEFRANPSTIAPNANEVVLHESPPTSLLLSEHVMKIGNMFPESSLTEIWQQLWNRAIVAAAATHLALNPRMSPYISREISSLILSDFRTVLGTRIAAARSPMTTLKYLIDRFTRSGSLNKHLNDPLWDDLETRVTELLADTPPLIFVIDAVDEDFAHAPAYWARCQKGLFYETMRLLRSPVIGARLHLLISIRDVVYHAVFRSEHAARYVGDPHLRLLDWSYEAARALLDAKTRRLRDSVTGRMEPPASFVEWLGFSRVPNSYGQSESVYDYALRHTQWLPRDIVTLGNLLGAAMDACRGSGTSMDTALFRRVVSDVATLSGHVQLGVAANQVVADEIPAEASRFGFVESYLSVHEYREDRIDQIKAIIKGCGRMRFGRRDLLELQARGRHEFGAPDLASVLWQCGLLGYQPSDEESAVFFTLDRLGRMRIPSDENEYVFHSSMHEVAGLELGDRPVLWRR
jgi:hypothetical protein